MIVTYIMSVTISFDMVMIAEYLIKYKIMICCLVYITSDKDTWRVKPLHFDHCLPSISHNNNSSSSSGGNNKC